MLELNEIDLRRLSCVAKQTDDWQRFTLKKWIKRDSKVNVID